VRSLVGAVVLLLMLAGLWLTSPALPGVAVSADAPDLPSEARQVMQGRIVAAELAPPDPFDDARPGTVFTVRIGDGALAGREAKVTVRRGSVASVADAARQYQVGDQVLVAYQPGQPGQPGAAGQSGVDEPFQLIDHRRWPWLLWGLAALTLGIVAVAGRQGVRALFGLGSAVLVLWWFIVPRILVGESPVQVALSGCALIAIPSLFLTHGLNRNALVPMLGTLGGLLLVGVLAGAAVPAAKLSGLAVSEEINLLYAGTGGLVDPRGLLLAGLLLGVVGALLDVTVAQAIAVFEFHQADPEASRRVLFTRGMAVGRAHVAAAVHTLALAYAGAGLPLLLLLALNAPILDSIWNRELVAAEALRTVTGCLGLAAAMPLTTWLACGMCSPRPRRRVYRPDALELDGLDAPAGQGTPDGGGEPRGLGGPEATKADLSTAGASRPQATG